MAVPPKCYRPDPGPRLDRATNADQYVFRLPTKENVMNAKQNHLSNQSSNGKITKGGWRMGAALVIFSMLAISAAIYVGASSFHTPQTSNYLPVDRSFHTPQTSNYAPVDRSFHTPPTSDYRP